MPRRSKQPAFPTRITFATSAPVYIDMRHDGTHWVVERVWVADEEVDMDQKHVEAHRTETLVPIPMDDLAAIAAFKAAKDVDADWPAWEIG